MMEGDMVDSVRMVDHRFLLFIIGVSLSCVWAADTPAAKGKKRNAPEAAPLVSASVHYPGSPAPRIAEAEELDDGAALYNKLFRARFSCSPEGGVRFEGMKRVKPASDDTLLNGGTELFSVRMANGKELKASDMKIKDALRVVSLKGDSRASRLSERLPGKALTAAFLAPDGSFQVSWRAVLRDDSHYLRQEFTIQAFQDVSFSKLTPMQYLFAGKDAPTISGNTTHGRLVVSEKLFAGLETPMSLMTIGGVESGDDPQDWSPTSWHKESFHEVFESDVPQGIVEKFGAWCRETIGPVVKYVKVASGVVEFAEGGECEIAFRYRSGNHKLNILGVVLSSEDGSQTLSTDVHAGHAGDRHEGNSYRVKVPHAGAYKLQYWVECRSESITSTGEITLSLPMKKSEVSENKAAAQLVQGVWERKALLEKGQRWHVSSVIGLFEPDSLQRRRSFLAYSERERAVPYRAFVHYNDWYEVGIRLHDYDDPLQRTTEKISLDILQRWQRELFNKRKTSIDAFVIDDGWDDWNSLWEFHAGFPRGFSALDRVARKMNAGLGVWLGPVGGYGKSKNGRLRSWNKNHPKRQISNFELSNREYFEAFVGRCRDMMKKYDMRYFKFDGISTKFHSFGPAGLEDAEGILQVVSALRETRPDVFVNATVGTWASPFWFNHVDSVWRQENDFGQVGSMGDARDKWISYRDRLVYEVFVQGAPLFPINSLMTHGTIITRNGPPHVMSQEPENCIKEMRAAFGSGSGLQEVYADADLLDQQNGRLWDELAACIAWIRRNADVLADVHWVGGNPWDGKDGDIYGWAAWNRKKCTLTLRNSSASAKSLKVTLRALFEVPRYLKGNIVLRSSFADQRKLGGLMDSAVDVDQPLEITLQPMEVIVMEGANHLHK